jgi:cation transport ATPase
MTSHAHIVHHTPGRLRLKVAGAKGNADFLDRVKDALGPIQGIREIAVNSVTGSVLVHYDSENFENFHQDVHDHASRNDLFAIQHQPPITKVDEAVDKIEREAEYLAKRSHTARVVVDFLHDLDVKVKQTTNNAVDLKVLVPLALAVYSITVIELSAATPMWATLGLFSFNHFLELHQHVEDPAAEDGPGGVAKKAKSLRQS